MLGQKISKDQESGVDTQYKNKRYHLYTSIKSLNYVNPQQNNLEHIKNKFITKNNMNQQPIPSNEGIQPQDEDLQINPKTEYYAQAQNLNDSKVQSVISRVSNLQNLLQHFQNYTCTNKNIDLARLHSSANLKLKKYKQSVYYGEYVNGKRHGKGIMVYNNGRVYEGDWQCDYKHGEGYEKFAGQCVYQGDYVNGRPEGVGRYSWPNGQFYQGQWVNGMKQGSGMWRGAKGDSYIGQWKFGKADGYGVHTWVNGDRYQGQFRQCLKHGEGIEKFANGDIYKGLYSNGKPCGFGQYYWANGSYFKGLFKNGLRDGQGLWKRGPGNSDKYEGQYINDKKSGYGIFTWATGNVYKGNYQSDIRNGYGEMYWNDGSYYKGQWKNGIQHGEGQIYVPGQGFKKGLFEDNVLVVLQKQSHAAFNSKTYLPEEQQHQQVPDPEKSSNMTNTRNGSNNTRSKGLMPSKVSFRSRGYSSKNRIKQAHSIDENIHTYASKLDSNYQNHPLLPKKPIRREQKYVTIQRRNLKPQPTQQQQQQKQRILHSSFYMHRLHNSNYRANTSINASKGDAESGYSNQISGKTKSIAEEFKHFNRVKVDNLMRTPH